MPGCGQPSTSLLLVPGFCRSPFPYITCCPCIHSTVWRSSCTNEMSRMSLYGTGYEVHMISSFVALQPLPETLEIHSSLLDRIQSYRYLHAGDCKPLQHLWDYVRPPASICRSPGGDPTEPRARLQGPTQSLWLPWCFHGPGSSSANAIGPCHVYSSLPGPA